MRNRTDDRGVRKTKKALRDSLAILLEHKDIQDISVKELTEQADVNRGTFYYHYKDIDDLVQGIGDEMLQEVDSLMQAHMINADETSVSVFFLRLIQYISANARFIRAFLSNSNASRTFTGYLKQRLVEDWPLPRAVKDISLDNDPVELEYYMHFLIAGYLEVITHWLETGLQESQDKVASLMNRIGNVCLGLF